MMGDFNAKVGSDNEDIEHVMGKHGLPPKRKWGTINRAVQESRTINKGNHFSHR